MKILYVVSGLGKMGGIESFIYNVISNIDLDNYHIDFFVSDTKIGEMEPFLESKGCKIYHITPYSSVLQKINNRNKFFKNHRGEWDIVHIHTVFTTAFSVARSAKKYGKCKCVIVHSHTSNNYEGSEFKNTICRPFLNLYTDVRLGCSKGAVAFLFGEKYKEDSLVLFNAVDYSRFKSNKEIRNQYIKELGIKDYFVIGHVGRMTEAKNHKFLLVIFNSFLQKHPKSKLILVGDGEYRERIEKQIIELGLQQSVLVLGQRTDVYELMQTFDCFVFPSIYEGLPTVLIEAQGLGIPIVCSKEITDEVIVNSNVVKLDLGDVNEWVNTIESMQPENNISPKIKLFSSEVIVKDLESIYSNVK